MLLNEETTSGVCLQSTAVRFFWLFLLCLTSFRFQRILRSLRDRSFFFMGFGGGGGARQKNQKGRGGGPSGILR